MYERLYVDTVSICLICGCTINIVTKDKLQSGSVNTARYRGLPLLSYIHVYFPSHVHNSSIYILLHFVLGTVQIRYQRTRKYGEFLVATRIIALITEDVSYISVIHLLVLAGYLARGSFAFNTVL